MWCLTGAQNSCCTWHTILCWPRSLIWVLCCVFRVDEFFHSKLKFGIKVQPLLENNGSLRSLRRALCFSARECNKKFYYAWRSISHTTNPYLIYPFFFDVPTLELFISIDTLMDSLRESPPPDHPTFHTSRRENNFIALRGGSMVTSRGGGTFWI